MGVFGYLGSLLCLYGIYGMAYGRIYARWGWGGRFFYKTEEPMHFWLACLSYWLGGGALIVASIVHPS